MSETNAIYTHVTAEWIRRPLPDLGGIAPADAVADADNRAKLNDLLIELAGHHVRLRALGLPCVDPAEVRKALGLEAAGPSHAAHRPPSRAVKPGPVKRNALLDELGTALTGGDVDSVAFFNVTTGAVEHFMHNLGDQENVRIAEAEGNADLRKVTPVTTEVRYAIMSDFISSVEDINVAGKLRSAISGKGAFRRFREAVDEDDGLRRRWLSYRTKRHYHLALDWLHGIGFDPAKYKINPAEFDWEPPKESAPAPQAVAPAPPDAVATTKPQADVPPAVENAAAETPPADTPVAQQAAADEPAAAEEIPAG